MIVSIALFLVSQYCFLHSVSGTSELPDWSIRLPIFCAILSEQECKTQWSEEQKPKFTNVGSYFHITNAFYALLSAGLPNQHPSLRFWYFILFCHTPPNALLQFPPVWARALALQLSVLFRSATCCGSGSVPTKVGIVLWKTHCC